MSAAAVSAASCGGVGCALLAAAVAYAGPGKEAFLEASLIMAGVALAILFPVAIMMPPSYPGEPRIWGIRAWLVRRALRIEKETMAEPKHATVVDGQASTPSTM